MEPPVLPMNFDISAFIQATMEVISQSRLDSPLKVFSKAAIAASLALNSIRAHKLRSFLTLLGIIIGVASVIIVGAAIDGLGAYTENITAKAFGSDSFLVAQIASFGRLSQREYLNKQRYNK